MRDTNLQSLLVLARAIGLSWETTRSVMTLAAKRYRHSTRDVVSSTGVLRTMRFYNDS
jgi:hypothetical protein